MHSHDHNDHAHSHTISAADATNKAFVIGIVLNLVYVVAQATAGFIYHSMALLSDAGHNLSDVASLALSMVAFRLARRKPTTSFTYGFKKSTILASLTNAVILFVVVGMLGYASINRFWHPSPIDGSAVAWVALIGIVVNFSSAMLFFRSKDHDLNTKGAYLHLMADAAVSVGVVISGIVIRYTNWFWLDPVVSIGILVVILISTWSLLVDSARLSLDAVPNNVDVTAITKLISGTEGVKNVHHTHVWAISTTENALTTHIVLDSKLSFDEKMKIVHNIKHELQHNSIHHATIELDPENVSYDAC